MVWEDSRLQLEILNLFRAKQLLAEHLGRRTCTPGGLFLGHGLGQD